MKTKAIEFLIAAAILFGLAFCFGCKEKAEAYEPNEPVGFTIEHLEFPDPDTVKELHLNHPEPNEQGYLKFDFTDAGFYEEPNEPTQDLMKCFERLLGQVDRLINLVEVCFDRLEKLEEPNEPEWEISKASEIEVVFDEPRPFKLIYNRELTPSEIAQIYDDPTYEPNDIIVITLPYPKGTKIYFKD